MKARKPIPFDVRWNVLRRADGCCEDCGEPRPLELHHTTYNLFEVTNYHRDSGVPIFGRETPDVLVALCRACHLGRHLGPADEFYADPEEAEEARLYWEEQLAS